MASGDKIAITKMGSPNEVLYFIMETELGATIIEAIDDGAGHYLEGKVLVALSSRGCTFTGGHLTKIGLNQLNDRSEDSE